MAPSHLEVSSVRGWTVCAVVKPGLRRLVVLIPPVASGLSLYCGCIDSLVVSVCVCAGMHVTSFVYLLLPRKAQV